MLRMQSQRAYLERKVQDEAYDLAANSYRESYGSKDDKEADDLR